MPNHQNQIQIIHMQYITMMQLYRYMYLLTITQLYRNEAGNSNVMANEKYEYDASGNNLDCVRVTHGAMSAAFRVAFNDSINSPRGRKLWDKAHGINVTSSVDGENHEYGIRGFICSVSTSGCNESYADEVYDYVNRNDVPFTDDDLRTGKHVLKPISWLPFGGDPIFHQQDTATRTSVNITLDGHRFHPGTVSHKVQFENGKLYYDLLGDGQGSTPSFNNDIGIYLFKPGVVKAVEKFRLD